MRSQVEEKFSDFYEQWLSQLEDLTQLLLVVSKSGSKAAAQAAIVAKLTAHHKEYYTFKWAAAHDDVLAFFGAPVWLSPFENAHVWITGWKPSTAFHLFDSLSRTQPGVGLRLGGVTAEQVKRVEALRVRMKVEEERVEREMERQQVAVANRETVELVRRGGGGDSAAATRAVEGWLGGLEKVMKMGDCVRLKTLKGLLDILSPMQCVEFLAYNSMLLIKIRKWGQGQLQRKKLL